MITNNEDVILAEDVGTDAAGPEEGDYKSTGGRVLSRFDIRHNLIVLIMVDAIWGMGSTDLMLASGPLYVYLKASNTIIGLTNSLMILALVGVFLSPFICVRLRLKKWYLLLSHIPYLGAWGAIGIALVLSSQLGLSNEWLLKFIIAMCAANWFFAGFVTLAHNEYVAACIPMSHRGRLSGYSYTVGGLAGMASAAIGGIILLRVSKPMSFGYLYLMMWLICQSGYILALFGRERPTPIENTPTPWSKEMWKAVWHDKPYLRMLVAFVIYNLTWVPLLTQFLPVYGFRELKMPLATSATILLVGRAVGLFTYTPIGHLIDRFSAKRVIMNWPWVALLAVLPVLLIRNQYAVYISAGITSIFWAGQQASFYALIYGMPKPEHRSGHFTVQILLMYGVGSVGSILIGVMCDVWSYRTVFFLAACLAVAMLPFSKKLLSSLSSDAKDYA